jgi:metallo-beta-lactamase family protein
MSLRLTFHGAAGCVTGSCMRLQTEHTNLLIDCGMFQGSKTLKELNYTDFPFRPDGVDAVLLTHAHIDHSGLLPKLMRGGFSGPIYATAATRDLCEIMLADAAGIQVSEVEHLNRRNQRRGRPEVAPIYRPEDAARVIGQFERVKLNEEVPIAPGVVATYWEAGHILGAASIELRVETADGPVVLLFSGDIGGGGSDYCADPQGPESVDYLIVESTYGDRERPALDPAERRRLLSGELHDAHAVGGPLLIPAFAVERTQELLADILTLIETGEAPEADIFLDSPLAIKATKIFHERGWNHSSQSNPFRGVRASERLKFLEKPWESDALDRLSGWHVILAGSGMCDAGRIRKHLRRWLWNRNATVLLAGFQATGTLGRLLAEGARNVRIQGEEVHVEARIRLLDVYSGHADARALTAWSAARGPVRGVTFLDHGEPEALRALRARLVAEGFDAGRIVTPEMDGAFDLARRGATAGDGLAPRVAARAASALDWHNARARLLGELEDALVAAPSDAARARMLGRIERALHKAAAMAQES